MATIPYKRRSSPRKDETGIRYGQLVGVRYAGNGKWLWLCDCGKHTTACGRNVRSGNTHSCGCDRNLKSKQRATKHGLDGTPAHRAWASMVKRCRAKTGAEYRDYASKGIKVCPEWETDAAAFIAYIGQPPMVGMSIDRIDNARGYEPGNVRWATKIEQANNKTNNRMVDYRGEKMTLSQMIRARSHDEGVPEKTMRRRIERELYGKGNR